MTDGRGLIERLVPEVSECPGCGKVARIARQTFVQPSSSLITSVSPVAGGQIVEGKAKIVEAFVLCLFCLRAERWDWRTEDQWDCVEVLREGPSG